MDTKEGSEPQSGLESPLQSKPNLALKLRPKLTVEWDLKLTQSDENPFPLAPFDAIAQGKVTARSYTRENNKLGENAGRGLIPELHQMAGSHIGILGWGLGRCARKWVPVAVKTYCCSVTIVDNSHVACDNATQFIAKEGLNDVIVAKTPILAGWEDRTIPEDSLDAYYVSQVIEHQGDDMYAFVFHLGAFLRRHGRRVIMIVPRREDNPPEFVPFATAVPPEDSELLVPLQDGLRGKVDVRVLRKFKYFHRTYTIFCFAAA